MYQSRDSITITGLGYALGDQCVTNEELIERHDIRIKPSFIQKSIGIETRYFLAPERAASDLATDAARAALDHAQLEPRQLDRIIVATSTGDYLSPSTACVVQQKLGAAGCPAHDVGAACSGFVYALDQAIRYLATGDNAVLVIGVDTRSRTLDWNDKRTVFLYGDGAGAVVVQRVPGEPQREGFVASSLYADGRGHDAVYVPSVGQPQQQTNKPLLCMPNGQRVSHNAGLGIPGLTQAVLKSSGQQVQDIQFYLFHQPNLRILESLCAEMDIPEEKTFFNFPQVGNTVAASIPILMAQAYAAGKLQPGMLVLLCAVGAGFTGGAHLLYWTRS